MAAISSRVIVRRDDQITETAPRLVRPAWHYEDPARRLRMAMQRLPMGSALAWDEVVIVRTSLNAFEVRRNDQVVFAARDGAYGAFSPKRFEEHIQRVIQFIYGDDAMNDRAARLLAGLVDGPQVVEDLIGVSQGNGAVVAALKRRGLVRHCEDGRLELTSAGRLHVQSQQAPADVPADEPEHAAVVEEGPAADVQGQIDQMTRELDAARKHIKKLEAQRLADIETIERLKMLKAEVQARVPDAATEAEMARLREQSDSMRRELARYQRAFDLLCERVPEVQTVLAALAALDDALASVRGS